MICAILAGGYGLRLKNDFDNHKNGSHPSHERVQIPGTPIYVQEGVAKPLVEVGGKPVISHLMEKIEQTQIRQVIIVTNDFFKKDFEAWAASYQGPCTLTVYSNGSLPEKDTRGPFQSVIDSLNAHRKIGGSDDDLLILAGDTLFAYDLNLPLREFSARGKNSIVVHRERPEFIRMRGVVQLDQEGNIIGYEEKPQEPKSAWAATPTFIFTKESLQAIRTYASTVGKEKQMGHLIPWMLAKGHAFSAFPTEEEIIDIGNLESLKLAHEKFGRPRRKSEAKPHAKLTAPSTG